MLKRKAYKDLLEWKNDRRNGLKKCLLVKGARQVGKTYLIKAFGKAEYRSFIYIDFFKQPNLKTVFQGDLTADDIYKRMSANMPQIEFIEGNTLIFLDEIQYCGNARTAIKFLAEDMRYDVISSGSLLGLSYGDDDDDEVETPSSVPVGYERQITMRSLDFEEFLWSYGYKEKTINDLKAYLYNGEQIPESIHDRYEMLFREFMAVGGMPEVVADFAKHKDFNQVAKIQNEILAEYQDDISKHVKGKKKQLVRMCYDAIPKQLAKEVKKFQYSTVEKGQTRRKFGGSIKWLKDTETICACYNVHEPHLPLMANADINQFKLYMTDTGLLLAAYGFQAKAALLNNTLKGNAKGGIYENAIAECLLKRGYNLYYWKPNDFREIEFLIEKDGEVVPVEVKAGNTATISLNAFIDEYHPSAAYKLIGGRNGKDGTKITLPHYMVMFL